MINSHDLRKGITIELDGGLYQVLDYQHIKIGRGSAQLRLRLRDIRGGHRGLLHSYCHVDPIRKDGDF